MPAYLFQIELPELTDEIMNMAPSHREYVNQLFSEGKLFSYSISESKEHIWCVVNADNEPEAMYIVSGFPLQKYFRDVTCFPLMLHNNLPVSLANISLN